MKRFIYIAWLVSAALPAFADFPHFQVKHAEVAVGVNGQRTWKVMGPDINGQYGGMHGVGGLEATVQELDGTIVPVVNDYFGNVLATISLTNVTWSPIRVGAYGPVMGYRPATVAPGTALADTLVWRSRSMDPSGLYCLGARYYDPVAGHFLSPDPLGHAASMDLYSFCNGDPLNRFDPTGCFGKAVNDFLSEGMDERQAQIDAMTDQYYAEHGYGYSPSEDQIVSSVLNWTPLVGAIKGFIELGTGNDLVTGQSLPGNGAEQAVTITMSTLAVVMPMAEIGMGAMEVEGAATIGGAAGMANGVVQKTEQLEFEFMAEVDAQAGRTVVAGETAAVEGGVAGEQLELNFTGAAATDVEGPAAGTTDAAAPTEQAGVQSAESGGGGAATETGGKYTVYQSVNSAGQVQYVGITTDFAARAAAHLAGNNTSGVRFVIEEIEGLNNLSLTDARAAEQTLIDTYGLGKNEGTLLNRINSISPINDPEFYINSQFRGQELLEGAGYPLPLP